MQKIMFDDRFGLTEAVLDGRKTMTRRTISEKALSDANDYVQKVHGTGHDFLDYLLENSPYKVGEVVAVAQSYKDAGVSFIPCTDPQWGCTRDMPGYGNKMFVRADLMPHQIRITSVRNERIQDISDEDCLREGIYEVPFCEYAWEDNGKTFKTAREAFAALIDKISGRGTWAENPLVFVYEFELVK